MERGGILRNALDLDVWSRVNPSVSEHTLTAISTRQVARRSIELVKVVLAAKEYRIK